MALDLIADDESGLVVRTSINAAIARADSDYLTNILIVAKRPIGNLTGGLARDIGSITIPAWISGRYAVAALPQIIVESSTSSATPIVQLRTASGGGGTLIGTGSGWTTTAAGVGNRYFFSVSSVAVITAGTLWLRQTNTAGTGSASISLYLTLIPLP